MKNRLRRKWFTQMHVYRLMELQSPLFDSYKGSLLCGSQLVQEEGKITSKYCNQRWCLVCGAIRTAKMIQEYSPVLAEIKDPHFVTLTKQDKAQTLSDLHDELYHMEKAWQGFRKKSHKKKWNIQGMLKLEITFNPVKYTYHPHYHIVINGESNAKELYNHWKKYWSRWNYEVSDKANKIEQCYSKKGQKWEHELFKYVTKMVVSDRRKKTKRFAIPPTNLDIIMQALRGKRVYRSFGIKKIKIVKEDIEELQSQLFDELDFNESGQYAYDFGTNSYVTHDGEIRFSAEPTASMCSWFQVDFEVKDKELHAIQKRANYLMIQNKMLSRQNLF